MFPKPQMQMTQASLEISLLGEWQYAHKRDVQSVLLKGAPNQVWYFIDLLCHLYFVTFVCCFNKLMALYYYICHIYIISL